MSPVMKNWNSLLDKHTQCKVIWQNINSLDLSRLFCFKNQKLLATPDI